MSDLETYLEEKKIEFEQILSNKDWAQIDSFFIEMEKEGYSQYVAEISELMTEEDVQEYKKWDEETNGSTATQTDDE